MKFIAVAIIAAACYTAGYIHGEWTTFQSIHYEIKIYERTLDREVPPKNFI